MTKAKTWIKDPAVSRALLIFIILRVFLTGWAILMNLIIPVPTVADEAVRPYLDEPQFSTGATGLLLGPWQRFDTQRYMRIAREGYTNDADSVFPPLYVWLVRAGSWLLGGGAAARLTAGILISNLATLALFILLHKFVTVELDSAAATRTVIYLALFPTGFFLFTAYTESLFILLALGSFWAGRNGRFWWAGILGFLAAMTRLTGWVLVIPLAYEWFRQHRRQISDFGLRIADSKLRITDYGLRFTQYAFRQSLPAVALPGLALLLFMAYRWWLGLPPLPSVYEAYWYQTTAFPGRDIFSAVNTLVFGGVARSNEPIQLAFDLFCTLLLTVTTLVSFRRLGISYGLYAALLLFFILLPTSPVKPLYSFSRYTLAFFPTFMLLGQWGRRPLINRIILYPSLALFLFFSGQFVIWGWVA